VLLLKTATPNPVDIFLVPAILFALSGAAAAGPKRLASDTYKRLNLSVIGLFLARLAARALPERVLFDYGIILEITVTVASFLGLLRGHQNEPGPKLLNSFTASS
jgi:hypothetical protein